jgi:hypothetical protein
MPGPYIDPNAPLQQLGATISSAFSAPIQPVEPGQAGPLTLPGAAPPAPTSAPGTFTPVAPIDPATNPAQQPVEWPQDPRGAADRAGGAPGGDPFPMDPRGAADRQPAMIPVTQTESSTQTTGPDAATAKNINAATGDANAAAGAAGTAKVGELNATADFERKEAQGQYGRGVNDFFTRAGELQTQDEILR